MNDNVRDIYNSTVNGDQAGIAGKIQLALNQGVDPEIILNNALISAMSEVGRRFEEGQYFLPEMLVSARAMQRAMNVLKPALFDADVKPLGKVVAGTVQGDMHDIGKNLVCMLLEGAGFEIIDLGKDVAPQSFVDAVTAQDAQLMVLSALLTTTMVSMQKTIDLFISNGLRDRVKIMVGGAPLTQQYANRIGADGYAADAYKAVALAKTLLLTT